jgi:hypothetical protein
VIGTFTTTKYDSRGAFIERRPSGVVVSRNSFTDVGLSWMWQMMTGLLRDPADGTLTDHLGKARLVVGDSAAPFSPADTRLAGENTAQAPLDSAPMISNGSVTFTATFGEDIGGFDWQERGVVTAQGVLLDRAVGDQGRKVLGAVWTLQAILELTR